MIQILNNTLSYNYVVLLICISFSILLGLIIFGLSYFLAVPYLDLETAILDVLKILFILVSAFACVLNLFEWEEDFFFFKSYWLGDICLLISWIPVESLSFIYEKLFIEKLILILLAYFSIKSDWLAFRMLLKAPVFNEAAVLDEYFFFYDESSY